MTQLHETLQDAVRMGFLHSSRARGRIPNSLRAAAEVRYLGHSGGGNEATSLHFEVPSLGSVAAELFEQQLLWEDGPKPEETAFELFAASVNDVRQRRTESNRFDPPLLRRISGYRRMLERGLERISMPDTALAEHGEIDMTTVNTATELSAATPRARRVRVAGRLDLMGKSQSVLKLHLPGNVVVTALWEGAQPVELLRDFFNREVVIEGTGVFRPSGSLLRIDADAIAAAGTHDDFFRTVPKAAVERDYHKLSRLRPGEPSVYARILGSIPAEESDEEFAAAIEELS
ncbi:MAG: hypothetical protein WCA06_20670 [Terrimicrobiaceae bacterium]